MMHFKMTAADCCLSFPDGDKADANGLITRLAILHLATRLT